MSQKLPDWHTSFPPPSLAEWQAQLTKTLKGKTDQDLQWRPEPGVLLDAYYTVENLVLPDAWMSNRPGQFPFLRGNHLHHAGDAWQIIQECSVSDPQILYRLKEATQAGIFGVYLLGNSISSEVWREIDFGKMAIHLASTEAPILSTTDLKMAVSLSGGKKANLTGTLLNDPISAAAADGKMIDKAKWVACEGGIRNMAESPYFRSLGLDVSYIKKQGGAIVHELAFALGTIVEYVDQLSNMGHQVSDVFSELSMTFAIGNQFFLEMAKFRAFRVLFAQLAAAYDIWEEDLQSPWIMARTTGRASAKDLPNHLIQATAQVLSAIIGGVHGVIAESGEDSNTARLNRNIQHLLLHESQLHYVGDPAGGSYYIETPTHQLAEEAWKLFQTLEQSGGFLANIHNGRVPGLIQAYHQLSSEGAIN